MEPNTFIAMIRSSSKPEGLAPELQALWLDARGQWEDAHELVQKEKSHEAAWVHAYLHRKEGDSGNAAYWYSRAGRPVSQESLEREWEEIVQSLLNEED